MMNGVPVQKIGLIGLGVVALFLIAGVVLIVTGHGDQGVQAMATATGVVIGTATTTTVVVQASGNGKPTSTPDPPKP